MCPTVEPRTGLHGVADPSNPDVLPIGHPPGLRVERLEDVLENGLPDIEKLPARNGKVNGRDQLISYPSQVDESVGAVLERDTQRGRRTPM